MLFSRSARLPAGASIDHRLVQLAKATVIHVAYTLVLSMAHAQKVVAVDLADTKMSGRKITDAQVADGLATEPFLMFLVFDNFRDSRVQPCMVKGWPSDGGSGPDRCLLCNRRIGIPR